MGNINLNYETFVIDFHEEDEGIIQLYRKQLELNRCIKVVNGMVPSVSYTIGHPSSQHGYKYHRLDGPAIINLHTGTILFVIDDIIYYLTSLFCKSAGMSDDETFIWALKFGDNLPATCSAYYGEDWVNMSLGQL